MSLCKELKFWRVEWSWWELLFSVSVWQFLCLWFSICIFGVRLSLITQHTHNREKWKMLIVKSSTCEGWLTVSSAGQWNVNTVNCNTFVFCPFHSHFCRDQHILKTTMTIVRWSLSQSASYAVSSLSALICWLKSWLNPKLCTCALDTKSYSI